MGWAAEEAEAAYWELSYEERSRLTHEGINFSAAIEEADMGYLNSGNGYQPTGEVNSEPAESAELWQPGVGLTDLERVGNAAAALGMDETDAEAVQQHLVDAGVFPLPQGTLEGHQPAPAPTDEEQDEALRLHSERVDTVGLDSQPHVPAGVHDLLAARFQQERTARRAAEQELEDARRLIGQGPFVIVKLASLNALTDSGQVEVRVGFGGGVTRHMLRAVLSLGQQAVADEAAKLAEQAPRGQVRAILPQEEANQGRQEATVRLPQPGIKACGHPIEWDDDELGCRGCPQPAERSQELPRIGDRLYLGPY